MKKSEVKIGSVYTAKVSDKIVEVRIDAENRHGGWEATNLATGKKVRIKSAQRLRAAKASKATRRNGADPTAAAESAPAADAAEAPATRKKAKPAKAKRVSAIDAAAQVLQAEGTAMQCKALIEAMTAQGLWSSPGGKTPQATLYSAIIREIASKGPQARFRKVERGQFAFNG